MVRISRERKEEIRNSILEVSKELFLTKGYENTSTSEIAKAVGIAEGTIFNYFKTKADIFLVVMSMDYINVTQEELDAIDLTSPIVDVIMDLVEKTMKKIVILPKKVLIEIGIATMNVAKSKPELIKKLAEIDFKFIEQVHDIVEKLIAQGALKPCDPTIFSESVYSVLMFEFIMYIYEKDKSLDDAMQGIRQKLEFLCKGYV